MKKVLVLFLAMAMILCVSGCSKEPEADYTVGIIQIMEHAALDAATEGFKSTLEAKMKEAGKTVKFEFGNAQGETQQCATIATNYANNKVDLILGNATPAVAAAINASSTIPVIGTSVTDFAEFGPLDSDGSSSVANLTGTSDGVDAQLYVNCTLDIVPDVKKVSVLYCSAESNSKIQADNYIEAMSKTKSDVVCTVYTFDDSNGMQNTVTQAIADCDALYIPTDNTAASNMTIVANACQPAKVPVICGEENMMKSGGLVTVSISYTTIGEMAGEMAFEILVNGADISSMPIEHAPTLVGKYNAAFAEAIGMTMPAGYEAAE